MRIYETKPPIVTRHIQEVPVYLGFFLQEDTEHYGLGPYIILGSGRKDKTVDALNCHTHIVRNFPYDTKVTMIKIDLTWEFARPGENL